MKIKLDLRKTLESSGSVRAAKTNSSCFNEKITDQHKIAAAEAIAGFIPESELRPDYIIPSIFDEGLVDVVAGVIE